MSKTIFVDIDGTLADLPGAVAKLLDIEPNWHQGSSVPTALGISVGQFWSTIESVETFWEDLPLFDYSVEFIEKLTDLGTVFLVSQPSDDPRSLSGKIRWIKENFGYLGRNYVLTPHKHFLAGSNRFLIDDNVEHIRNFRRAGGVPLFLAQPWNVRKGHLETRMCRTTILSTIKEW